MLFVIATLAIAGAAVGPIFLSSSATSVLATTLSSSPPGLADVLFLESGSESIVHQVDDAAKTANTASHDLLAKPIFVADLGTGYLKSRVLFVEDLLWRTDICQHLRMIQGVCTTKNGTVSLSARSAKALGDHVGSRIHLSLANNPKHTWVTVVGIYLQPPTANTSYWRGINYFQYGSGSTVGTNAGAKAGAIASIVLDPLVTSRATVFAASAANEQVQYSADAPWRPKAWVIGKGALRGALARIESSLAKTYQIQVESGLPSIIASAQHNVNLMSAIVLAIVLQLVLLALVVLYGLGRSTAAGRRVEADFARRRGFTRAGLLFLAVSEPAALIGAALPVGILVAWGAMRIFGDTYLYRGVSVGITWLSVVAGLAAFVAAIVATALASYGLWRHASRENRRAGTTAVMVDAFGVALGVAGLLALATKGALNGTHANPLAAIAPGLLAVGGAVIGLRLTAVLAGGLVRSTARLAPCGVVPRHPADRTSAGRVASALPARRGDVGRDVRRRQLRARLGEPHPGRGLRDRRLSRRRRHPSARSELPCRGARRRPERQAGDGRRVRLTRRTASFWRSTRRDSRASRRGRRV